MSNLLMNNTYIQPNRTLLKGQANQQFDKLPGNNGIHGNQWYSQDHPNWDAFCSFVSNMKSKSYWWSLLQAI